MCNCDLCRMVEDTDNVTYIAKMNYGTLYLNWNQIYYGRVMYIYDRHVKDITEINITNLQAIMFEVSKVSKAIKDLFQADTVEVATLGNEVQHLHYHIIPRRKSDKNWGKPPWPHDNYFPDDKEKADLVKIIKAYLKVNGIIER